MKIEMMEYLSNKISDVNILKKVIEVLDKMNFLETKEIINALEKCDYNNDVYKIIVDLDVLKKRTIEEQLKLIEICTFKDKRDKAFGTLTNTSLLITTFADKRIKIMNKKQNKEKIEKISNKYNLEKISTLEYFKSYLNELKNEMGKDADIKSDTMVKVYNPKE